MKSTGSGTCIREASEILGFSIPFAVCPGSIYSLSASSVFETPYGAETSQHDRPASLSLLHWNQEHDFISSRLGVKVLFAHLRHCTMLQDPRVACVLSVTLNEEREFVWWREPKKTEEQTNGWFPEYNPQMIRTGFLTIYLLLP